MRTEGDLVARYIAFRAKVQALEAECAAACKPYKLQMLAIEGHFLGKLNERGSQSVATPGGTYYKSTTMQPKLTDRIQLVEYVAETGEFDVFTNAVSKTYVQDRIYKYGSAPPGIEAEYFTKCNFRK